MWAAGMLAVGALVATVAFHLRKQTFRDIRVSVAALLPEPPQSKAPKTRISLVAPLMSLRFWIRLAVIGLLLMALAPFLWALALPAAPDSRAVVVRIVLDTSASMQVGGPGASRFDQALGVLAGLPARIAAAAPDACTEWVVAGARLAALDAGAALPARPDRDGAPVGRLLAALSPQVAGSCGAVPSHAVVVTDTTPRPVSAPVFGGHVIWHQVGAPLPNAAIDAVSLLGGGLSGVAAKLSVRIAVYGADLDTIAVTGQGPEGPLDFAVRRDPDRDRGWLAEAEVRTAGRHDIEIAPGGGFDGDDRVTLQVSDPSNVAVDWQLPALPAPARFVAAPRNGTDAIRVAPVQALTAGGDPARAESWPAGRFLGTYAGWRTGTPTEIGPFLHQHPILAGLNLDVWAAGPPTPAGVTLPPGFVPVLRADLPGAPVWIAVRETPRGAIVPTPVPGGDTDQARLGAVVFFNALRWVAEGGGADALTPVWRDAQGGIGQEALSESDTARALAEPPDYARLGDAPRAAPVGPADSPVVVAASSGTGAETPLAPWYVLAALVMLLIDRAIGPVWRRRDQA